VLAQALGLALAAPLGVQDAVALVDPAERASLASVATPIVNRDGKADRGDAAPEAEDARTTSAFFAIAADFSGALARDGFTRPLPAFHASLDPLDEAEPPPATPLPLGRPETPDEAEGRLARLNIRGSRELGRAHRCLAEAIYFESRSESERGQQAVAQVVLNRVRSGRYPADVCGVIYQNARRMNRCQFSYACDGRPERIRDEHAWERASRIADDAIAGRVFLDEIGDSTHYHATYVAPRWRRSLARTEQIGTHIFYRLPGLAINGS
jgi:hypothetical protein